MRFSAVLWKEDLGVWEDVKADQVFLSAIEV